MIQVLIAIVLAAIRIALVLNIVHFSELGTNLFKDAAHMFVAGLIGAAAIQFQDLKTWRAAWLNTYIVIALTVVEVGCFLWFRFA